MWQGCKTKWHEVSLCSQWVEVDCQYRCWVGQRQLNLDRRWPNVAAAKGSPASCRCPSWTRLGSARLDPFHASLVGSAAVHLIVASPLSVTHQKATLASPGITLQSFKIVTRKKQCHPSSLLLLLLVTSQLSQTGCIEVFCVYVSSEELQLYKLKCPQLNYECDHWLWFGEGSLALVYLAAFQPLHVLL